MPLRFRADECQHNQTVHGMNAAEFAKHNLPIAVQINAATQYVTIFISNETAHAA